MPDAVPTVTVVIPLYNGAAFVGETLDSLAAQTMSDIEVLVVDDGSADDGPALVARHPVGARLLRQEHLGVAVARNRGLALARGRWVTFVDQDDLWHPTRLERLLDWLARHPEERLVSTTERSFDLVEEKQELTSAHGDYAGWAEHTVSRASALADLVARADVSGSPEVEHYDVHDLLRGPVTVTTSFLADPELLRVAGGFAPHALAMDDYWLLVNAVRIRPMARVDQPTVFYRVHLTATSRTTRLALPYLSSAVALRLGGGLIDTAEGLRGGLLGPLHRHLLTEVLDHPEQHPRGALLAVRALALVLHGRGGARALARAEVRRRTPASLRAAVRRTAGSRARA